MVSSTPKHLNKNKCVNLRFVLNAKMDFKELYIYT